VQIGAKRIVGEVLLRYCHVKSLILVESVDEYLQAPLISAATRPADIISYAVWLYYQFNLSHRDIEDLVAERGITVSHESVRLWCNKFGPKHARRLKRSR
jgi:hypothetical protein